MPSVPLADAQRPLFAVITRPTMYVDASVRTGAAVLISKYGLLITARHVIAGQKTVHVQDCRLSKTGWTLERGSVMTADVILEDKPADIAVFLIRELADDMRYAVIGDSTRLKPGDPLYRVGWDVHQLASGHLINVTKTSVMQGKRYRIPRLNISMRADLGSSGGPVYNAAHELVGIALEVSGDLWAPTISYAIPIHTVMRRISWRNAVKPHLPRE